MGKIITEHTMWESKLKQNNVRASQYVGTPNAYIYTTADYMSSSKCTLAVCVCV